MWRKCVLIWLLLASGNALALDSVTLMADHSVSLVTTRLAREYARRYNVSVNTSFLPKATQAAQLLEGGTADILITMDVKWIEALKTQGLVDVYSITPFMGDKLVLVGPLDSPLHFPANQFFTAAPLIRTMQSEPGFLVGNPEYVPEGAMSKEALRNANMADVLEPYTLYLKDTHEMLEQVYKNGAYGLFLYSEAAGNSRVKILNTLPESGYSPIIYYAVVIAGERMDDARNFLKFLKTANARNIIQGQGMLAR